MTNPPPRPALRKAPDSDRHPALPPRPLAGVTSDATARPGATVPAQAAPASPPAVAPAPAAPPGPAAPAPADGAAGGSASDTLRPRKPRKEKDTARKESREHRKRHRDVAVPAKADKDKTVVVEVPMPKSLRRRLDARAEELGYSRDEAVLLLLRAWLDD